jgi:hypothetical protein
MADDSTQIGLTTYIEAIQITPSVSSFSISNVILGASRWQNPGNRFDVLNDGTVDINDYNTIINYIASNGSGMLPRKKPENQPYVDVNGDGQITSQDADQLLAYLQRKKLIDTTPTTSYPIVDFKIKRDLVNPITVTTIKDVAAQQNIFPTADYLIFRRNLSTNELTPAQYSESVASRDSLVFVNSQVMVPIHPFTPGCDNNSCILRLIKERIAAAEILPIRFNKIAGATGVLAAGAGLPIPGTDTSEMPAQPVVEGQAVEPIVYVEQTTETDTDTTDTTDTTVVTPPVVVLDPFPSPCVIIGEIKFVCAQTSGSSNTSTSYCTAKMTSNTTPTPYVASADSEASSLHSTYLGQYIFKSYRYGVLQISTTLDPTTSDFYHWIAGDYEINWALAGGDDPARMAGFIDPRTIPGAYMICLEDVSGPRGSVFDSCVLVIPQLDGSIRCAWNGESGHVFQHKMFGPGGNVLFDPFQRGNEWYTWEVPGYSCPAWKAFNRANVDEADQWESASTVFPHYLQYDFHSSVIVNKYALLERNSFDYVGFPRDFTLQGSNDNVNWTVLDTKTGMHAPGPNSWTQYFTFTNGSAYRYYRLNVTSVIGGGNRVNVGELKLICSSIDGADNSSNTTCTAVMSSDNLPTPKAAMASGEYYSSYRDTTYSAWKAFNGTNLGEPDRWISANSVPPWHITYDFGSDSPVAINKYAIQQQNYNGVTVVNDQIVNEQNYSTNDGFPRDFTLQGSHNGTTWVVLDTRVNVTAPGMNNWTADFTFSNGTAYRYYKINVTAVNGQLAMPVTGATGATGPTDCVITASPSATIRYVVITQYNEDERTTAIFHTAGHSQTTLYSNQDLIITFNAYDVKGVYAASLWLDGVKIPISTGPHADTTTGGVNFGVAIGKRAAGVHNYTIIATNNDGVETTPPYTCWFTVLQGGA